MRMTARRLLTQSFPGEQLHYVQSSTMNLKSRLSVVILTHNRAHELLRTVERIIALPEAPSVVVVNNGSTDETANMLKHCFPAVTAVNLKKNLGAAGRNAGVEQVTTPYVAFCDDDTWWAPGSLHRAAVLLDAFPCIAVLSARILIGPQQREYVACVEMAASPLPSAGLPGNAVLGFTAGACVFRRTAFWEAGGYEPRFFMGGEEALLALDLAARGWVLVYSEDLTAYHYPALQGDPAKRRRLINRNALWVAWMRRPTKSALRETWRTLRSAQYDRALIATCLDAASGLPWALRNRKVVPERVEALRRLIG